MTDATREGDTPGQAGPYNNPSGELVCVRCSRAVPIDQIIYRCPCGGLLEVQCQINSTLDRNLWDSRLGSRKLVDRSGVWRFREAVLPIADMDIVSHPEGGTYLYEHDKLRAYAHLDQLWFKHEGENPTGSFKDRGMTVAISQAHRLGMQRIACASTGNTSASLAAYAAQIGLEAVVMLPAGKIAQGKLAQAIAYGARCLAIHGDFDDAMRLVADSAEKLGLYLVNSVNPFRLEGQKTIIWEMLQDLGWKVPDWIVVPGGNLGNTSAFGKALREAKQVGWIDKVPRLLTVQAEGANPFYLSFRGGLADLNPISAETVATAIRIGNPVNFEKAVMAIRQTNGVVTQVSDQEILEAKRAIDQVGIGCEPASAATLAAVKKHRLDGTIGEHQRVVCILTGNVLKDTDSVMSHGGKQSIVEVEATLDGVEKALRG